MIIIKAKIKGVSSMVAFLRVYVKAVMLKTVGWNDYMVSEPSPVEENEG